MRKCKAIAAQDWLTSINVLRASPLAAALLLTAAPPALPSPRPLPQAPPARPAPSRATMLPTFGGSGNLLVEQDLMGGTAPGAPAFLGSSAAGAGAAADPGFFVEPESPAAGVLGRQPFSPGARRGSGFGAMAGLGSGGLGSGAWLLGPSGSLAPGSSRDLMRDLECQEDLFLPSAPSTSPPTGAAPTTGVTVVPPAAQQGGTGTSPPTPPTLPSTLRWHEALAAFPPLPPSAVPPAQPLQTQPPAGAPAGYGLAPAPLHVQLARPQASALFVAPLSAPGTAAGPR